MNELKTDRRLTNGIIIRRVLKDSIILVVGRLNGEEEEEESGCEFGRKIYCNLWIESWVKKLLSLGFNGRILGFEG